MTASFYSIPPVLPRVAALDTANVWRASEIGSADLPSLDTGYPELNRELPGGGWPQGAMVEVLQPQAGQHEWGLLAPVLAGLQAARVKAHGGQTWLALTGAPYLPFGPALRARQISMHRLLCIHPNPEPGMAPTLLWATREALQCADVAAVLAWLPDARSAHLRRLQIAAHTHNKLLFVFRPLRAQHESSPAPLRLLLQGHVDASGGGAGVQVHVLKRRGPPLTTPVWLDTRPDRLSALLMASRERVRQRRQSLVAPTLPVTAPAPAPAPAAATATATALASFLNPLFSPSHALDRTASAHH